MASCDEIASDPGELNKNSEINNFFTQEDETKDDENGIEEMDVAHGNHKVNFVQLLFLYRLIWPTS